MVRLRTRARVPDTRVTEALLPIGFSSPMHGSGWSLGLNVVLGAQVSPGSGNGFREELERRVYGALLGALIQS